MSQSEKPSAIAPSTATSMTQLDDNIKRIKTTGGATPSLSASTLTQDEKTAEEQADGVDLEKKETYVSLHAPQSFPDGGYAAWACTFGAFCCLFCSFGTSLTGHVVRQWLILQLSRMDKRNWYFPRLL
jgi:hypothetical protein